MNEGQAMFYTFIMESFMEEHQAKAKPLLLESFRHQDEGTFTEERLTGFHAEIESMLRPDKREEVLTVMRQSGSDHISK